MWRSEAHSLNVRQGRVAVGSAGDSTASSTELKRLIVGAARTDIVHRQAALLGRLVRGGRPALPGLSRRLSPLAVALLVLLGNLRKVRDGLR